MNEVRLDDNHTYWFGDRRLFGVNEVLDGVGLKDTEFSDDLARERGSAVHEACFFLDEGRLDWNTVAPQYIGYVSAWPRAKEALGLKIRLREYLVCDELYGYGGKLDVEGEITARLQTVKTSFTDAVLDLKTGEVKPWNALQMAAYGFAYNPNKVYRRIAVRLYSDGDFKLHEFPVTEYFRDVNRFLSFIQLLNWRRNNV